MSVFTVDADVFISAFLPAEPHHASSLKCLTRLRASGDTLACPRLLIVEVASALIRNTGDRDGARDFALSLVSLSGMRLFSLDDDLCELAVQAAVDSQLRGADAVYVAVALQQRATLVTWDRQMLTRAAALVSTTTPQTVI